LVAAGTYGGQNMSGLAAKPTADKIVFRPAGGAVTLDSLNISGSQNIEVRDMKAPWNVRGNAKNITLRNITILDQEFGGYVGGVDGLEILGGEIGRIDPQDGLHLNNADGPNSNVMVDGLYMHDLTRNTDNTVHTDCVQTGSITNLIIRNSRFVNCATQGIFLNPYNGGVSKNITLENNWIGPAQLGYNAIYVGGSQNVTIRNNSIVGSAMFVGGEASGVKVVGNILTNMENYGCQVAASNSDTFAYNVTNSTCSGAANNVTNASVASQFVNSSAANAGTFDLHLKSGAAAIDKGSPSDYPSTDFDGKSRPAGGAPDAGASEYGAGGGPVVTPTPTPTVTPTPTSTPSPTPTAAPTNPATSVWNTPTNAVVGKPATFDGCASTGDGTLSFEWASGAFSQTPWATTCRATYTFQSAGTKVISLRVTDADGSTAYSEKTFDVAAAAAPTPTATPSPSATPTPTPTATPTPSPTPTATPTPSPTPTATPTPSPTPTPTPGPSPSEDLVGAFGFDEASGTKAIDSSDANNVGTISGATRTTGKFGGALRFDGKNDLVSAASSAELTDAAGITFEAWINPTTTRVWQTVASKEGSTMAYGLYGASDTGKPAINARTTREYSARSASALPVNKWSHVAATYDGKTLRLYVNGVEKSALALTGELSGSTSDMIRIGGNKVWGEWFAGKIDEVRLYKRALTAAEIQRDMNTAVTGTVAAAASLKSASAKRRSKSVKRIPAARARKPVHGKR
jgi:hypothetical protein